MYGGIYLLMLTLSSVFNSLLILLVPYYHTVTKDLASVLVKKWKAMVGRAGGPPKKAATPASAAAPTSAPAAQSTKKRPENADDEGAVVSLLAILNDLMWTDGFLRLLQRAGRSGRLHPRLPTLPHLLQQRGMQQRKRHHLHLHLLLYLLLLKVLHLSVAYRQRSSQFQ